MQPATSTQVSPTTPATQWMRIENPTQVPIRLRIKISYTHAGGPVEEICEFSSFDASLWA